MRALIFLLSFLFFSSFLFSQKKELQEADLLFFQKNYREASAAYIKIYERNKDRALLLKIGDSFFSLENYVQAQNYYKTYFADTIYEAIPQFQNYAKSAKMNGNIPLVVRLNKIIFEKSADESAKSIVDLYSLYTDSISFVRSYDLDSNYRCIVLDASAAIDSMAAPLFYMWDFGNGQMKEGISVEHCFPSKGEYKVVLSVMDRLTGYTRKNDTTLMIELEDQPVVFHSPKTGRRYFYLDFDASPVDLPGYDIIDYIWDLGNGETTTGKKMKYKFNESADYKVRLAVLSKNKYTHKKEIFSAYRVISVKENYETPSKKFSDDRDTSK